MFQHIKKTKSTYIPPLRLRGLCFCLFFLLTACQKDEDTLPEETQHGANTFGCKVNGQVWTHGRSDGGGSSLQPYLEPNGGLFSISAFGSNLQDIGIGIRELNGEGVYPVFHTTENRDTTTSVTDFAINYTDWTKNCVYRRLSDDIYIDGFIEITKYDMENYIVAGRFEALMATEEGCDTIRITEGRFDIGF